MKIIGVAGKAGAGKDTVGEIISDYLINRTIPHVRRNFADALKNYCREKYGLTHEEMYTEAGKSSFNSFWGVTPRKILQFEGTEATRNIIGNLLPGVQDDFWIRRLELFLDQEEYSACECAIICDVRFQNEADWVIENGFLININREDLIETKGIPNHASEIGFQIQSHQFRRYYEVSNNGTIQQLKFLINSILMKEIL